MTISKSFGLLGWLMCVFNMDATFLLYRYRELIWNLVLRDFKGQKTFVLVPANSSGTKSCPNPRVSLLDFVKNLC